MPFPRTLRGDIAQILNLLVAGGVIKGFSTNLFEKPSPRQLVVTVTVHHRDEAQEAYRKVNEALDLVGQPIVVSVDLPEMPETRS